MCGERVDLRFKVKALARRRASPREVDYIHMQRLVRYMAGATNLVLRLHAPATQSVLNIDVESDWAGCLITRRSTSSALVRYGDDTLMSRCVTQATPALSMLTNIGIVEQEQNGVIAPQRQSLDLTGNRSTSHPALQPLRAEAPVDQRDRIGNHQKQQQHTQAVFEDQRPIDFDLNVRPMAHFIPGLKSTTN